MTFDIPFMKRNHYLMQKFLPGSCQISIWALPTHLYNAMNLCHLQSPVGSSHPPALSSSLVPLGSFALSFGTEVGVSRSPTRNENYARKSRGLGYNFIDGGDKGPKAEGTSWLKITRVLSHAEIKIQVSQGPFHSLTCARGHPKLLDERGT